MRVPLSVLETASRHFPGSSLAVAGCAASRIRSRYCEIDLLAYPASGQPKLIERKDVLYRVVPLKSRAQLYLGEMQVARDESWSLSSLSAGRDEKKVARLRRAASLRRQDAAASFAAEAFAARRKEDLAASTLNMLSAVARAAEAALLASGEPIHPSHMVARLRERGELPPLAAIASFDLPSTSNCQRRIGALESALPPLEARIAVRKLRGALGEGRPFDMLFYSYWLMAGMLEKGQHLAVPLGAHLRIALDQSELDRKLEETASLLRRVMAAGRAIQDENQRKRRTW
ncbi:MAG: hypothetical protein JRN39_08215 [Nitrososphaerota archaeon]|nr:hypothetical protein [Nitrososphaerota archaeon]